MSILKNFPVLLPKKADYEKWAVIACDQYTTDYDYWKNLEEYVGNAPSALRVIFPEIYLNDNDVEQRIKNINEKMTEYLNNGFFTEVDGMVLIERDVTNGKRIGLVACVDLDEYNYGSDLTQIRSTEETIEDRLPIRIHIRENASIELPHILLLLDDVDKSIITPLYNNRQDLEKLYDFDLNMNGGHIKGYRVPFSKALTAKFDALLNPALQTKKYGYNANILFAVGDGNHSMATAKKCWEKIKPTLTEKERENHPARYVLAEIVNIYDDAISFEPIHRNVYNINPDAFISEMEKELNGDGKLTLITDEGERVISCPAESEQAIIKIQKFLEQQKKENGIIIEYVHEENQMRKDAIEKHGVGILMPQFPKNKLFNYIVNTGKLPKKAFSIGEEKTKKYYIEAKRIK